MLQIEKKPMLYHVIKQVKVSKFIDDVIVATTTSSADKRIVKFCVDNDIRYFRGSEKDVLDRYYKCAKKFQCDPVVRISSDCPMIDPRVITEVINKFLKNSYDYVCNNFEWKNGKWVDSLCNFPDGMVIEISSFKTLEKAWKNAKKQSEREHVFPYVVSNPQIFKISNVKHRTNLSYIRCTVDKKADLKFVREIYKRISKRKKVIHIKDILKIVNDEPSLLDINKKM